MISVLDAGGASKSTSRERIGILAALKRAVDERVDDEVVLKNLEIFNDRAVPAEELVIDLNELFDANCTRFTVTDCTFDFSGVITLISDELDLEAQQEFNLNEHLQVRMERVRGIDGKRCSLCFQGAFHSVDLTDVELEGLALGRQSPQCQFLCWKLGIIDCVFGELQTMFWERLTVLDVPRMALYGCRELHWSGGRVEQVQWTMATSCEVRGWREDGQGRRVMYKPTEIVCLHVVGRCWHNVFRGLYPNASVRLIGEPVEILG